MTCKHTLVPVRAFCEDGSHVGNYASVKEASTLLGVKVQGIVDVCRNRQGYTTSTDGRRLRFQYADKCLQTDLVPELPGSLWKHCHLTPTYEISNLGQIRNTKTKRILRHLDGIYLCVHLYINQEKKIKRIHHLVANAWLGTKPSADMVVNHKDGNRKNNAVDNLEWTTVSGNTLHAYRVLGVIPAGRKPIEQLDKQGRVLRRFTSIHEAARICRLQQSCVSQAVSGHIRSSGGFHWRLAEDRSTEDDAAHEIDCRRRKSIIHAIPFYTHRIRTCRRCMSCCARFFCSPYSS